jgi:C4-type Zn-finger protein
MVILFMGRRNGLWIQTEPGTLEAVEFTEVEAMMEQLVSVVEGTVEALERDVLTEAGKMVDDAVADLEHDLAADWK